MKNRLSVLCTLVLLAGSIAVPSADAGLVFGLDAVAETSTLDDDATFNVFNGQGVDITNPTTVTDWLSSTNGYVPTRNPNTSQTAVSNMTGSATASNLTVSYKVDLTGSHDVTFDKFAVAHQRAGNPGASNTISNAMYSIDGGTTFSSATVQEVAVGDNNGTNNVGPADTITDFRTPNGFGGTISPQQTYVVSGLGAAGTLNSGSLIIKYDVGISSAGMPELILLDDRYDVTTDAMGLASFNTTNLGADDGYDIAWFGTAVPVSAVPEPSSLAYVGVAGLSFLVRRRR